MYNRRWGFLFSGHGRRRVFRAAFFFGGRRAFGKFDFGYFKFWLGSFPQLLGWAQPFLTRGLTDARDSTTSTFDRRRRSLYVAGIEVFLVGYVFRFFAAFA